jgi:hypothetical protein
MKKFISFFSSKCYSNLTRFVEIVSWRHANEDSRLISSYVFLFWQFFVSIFWLLKKAFYHSCFFRWSTIFLLYKWITFKKLIKITHLELIYFLFFFVFMRFFAISILIKTFCFFFLSWLIVTMTCLNHFVDITN